MPRKRKRKPKTVSSLPLLQPDAAGVDIGATEIYVAVPPDRDPEPVRSFATFTPDLERLADWLEECGIRSVAMESTSVYWIPLFQILEQRGLEVCLVNARHVKNVPGRKTDVSDCQWLQYLHSVGLLRASFRPAQAICAVRSLLRHRENLVQMASQHVHHMQKALDQMNLQLHHVISDLTGLTGLTIVEAILGGERDPQVLAKLRHKRIKASEETIAKSLVGDYRPEHVFSLRQSLAAYRSYQQLVAECNSEIERSLAEIDSNEPPSPAPGPEVEAAAADVDFDLGQQLQRIWGVDLTQVPGLNTLTVRTLLGEIGPDFSKFPTVSAFASWLGLCPDNEITGGKVLRVGTRKVNSRAAKALRLAAQSLHHSKSALGAFYRGMRTRLGAPKAITAAAHKLARIIYHLVTHREAYDDSIFALQQARYKRRAERKLRAQARTLGFQLVPAEPTAH
ncbi:MAG: IS110 family transposase [Gemmatimonadales bacterium]